MAYDIGEGAHKWGVDVEVKKVEECQLNELLAADGILIGSPTYFSNVSWQVKKLIDESIQADKCDALSALVAAFPIPTSEGLLNERDFRDFLKRIKKRLSPAAALEKRLFEKLDDHRVVCMEEWPTADPSDTSTRWLFFRRMGKDWKLEMIFFSHNSVDSGSNGSL